MRHSLNTGYKRLHWSNSLCDCYINIFLCFHDHSFFAPVLWWIICIQQNSPTREIAIFINSIFITPIFGYKNPTVLLYVIIVAPCPVRSSLFGHVCAWNWWDCAHLYFMQTTQNEDENEIEEEHTNTKNFVRDIDKNTQWPVTIEPDCWLWTGVRPECT